MLPADRAASSTPPAAAEPRAWANAGTATWTTPTAVPNTASTANTDRIPGAASGPSHVPWAAPRHAREAGLNVYATAEHAPSAAASTSARLAEATATIPATIAGAV